MDKPLPAQRATGIGVVAYNQALALSRIGTKTHYICRGAEDGVQAQGPYLTIRTLRHFSMSNFRATLRELKEFDPEVVHVHSSSGFPSVLLSRVSRRRVFVHSHGVERFRLSRPSILRDFSFRLANRIISVSRSEKQLLSRTYGIAQDKIVVVYNGVDTNLFRPTFLKPTSFAEFGISESALKVLTVGTLYRVKGQAIFIECLPKILERFPNLVYICVGSAHEPGYADSLLRRAKSLGVEGSVKLIGSVPHSKVAELINSVDLCVQPSLREGFGNAILEELACGRPVVASSVGIAQEEIQHHQSGILVSPGDIAGLTDSVIEVLQSPELARTLAANARGSVLYRFTWEKSAENLQRVYTGALSRKNLDYQQKVNPVTATPVAGVTKSQAPEDLVQTISTPETSPESSSIDIPTKKQESYSICMLCYNNGNTVRASIESLHPLSNYFQTEIVVVDNLSRDGSRGILADLVKEGKVTEVVERKCSRGKGRQLALENSHGEYVLCHLDCDDVFDSDAIRELIILYHKRYQGLVMMTKRPHSWLHSNITIAPREVLDSIGGWRDLNWIEDWDLWERADEIGKYAYHPYPEPNPPHSQIRVLVGERQSRLKSKVTSRYGKYRDSYRIGKPPFLGERHVTILQRLIAALARIMVKIENSKLLPVSNPYFGDVPLPPNRD